MLMQSAPKSRFSYATRKAVILSLRRLRAKEAAEAAAALRRRAARVMP